MSYMNLVYRPARQELVHGSVVRASDRCTEGHRFDSCQGLRFFLVLCSWHVDHIISHFFTKLKIYHLSLFIKKVLLGKQEFTSWFFKNPIVWRADLFSDTSDISPLYKLLENNNSLQGWTLVPTCLPMQVTKWSGEHNSMITCRFLRVRFSYTQYIYSKWSSLFTFYLMVIFTVLKPKPYHSEISVSPGSYF